MGDILNVTVGQEGGATVVALSGEFDLSGRPTFDQAFEAVDPGATEVVFDLSELAFIDSTGLGCFARAQNALAARGARLVLRHPSATVRRVLDLVDLGRSIEVID